MQSLKKKIKNALQCLQQYLLIELFIESQVAMVQKRTKMEDKTNTIGVL